MHSIGLGIIASVVLVASLTAQASTGRQAPIKDTEPRLDASYSTDLDSRSYSVPEHSFTLAPGGIAELHGNTGRPTLLQVIKGTLTSHPEGQPESVLHAGDGLVEGDGNNYWIENTGTEPAEFIFLHIHDNRAR